MHVCDQFFRAPVGGHNSRASTIVHEVRVHLITPCGFRYSTDDPHDQSSHFTRNGGTEDHAYGESLAQELARNYPQMAVMNADNHEYYAAGAHGDELLEDESVVLSQTYFGGDVFAV